MSYSWKMFVANPLHGPFASIGMPATDIEDEPKQDPTPFSGSTRSDHWGEGMATVNYTRVVDYVHPQSGKIIEVPSDWLPCWILFDYDHFICASGLYSPILHHDLNIAHPFGFCFFFANI